MDYIFLERIILQNCILFPESIDIIKAILKPSDFFVKENRDIFQLCLDIKDSYRNNSKEIDSGMLLLELRKVKDLSGYIPDLAEVTVFSIKRIEDYAKELKRLSLLRELKFNISRIMEENDLNEFLTRISNIVDSALVEKPEEKTEKLKDIVDRVLKEIDEKMSGNVDNINTGIEKFDMQFGGLKPGRLYIIGARPGFGKTSLLINIAYSIAQKYKVLFFTLEMSNIEIIKRILSMVSMVDNRKLENPILMSDTENNSLNMAINNVASLNLKLIDDVYLLNSIKANIIKEKPKLVIVDYLQLMKFSQRQLDRMALSLSLIARELKVIAKEYNCAIFLASQLSREVERRAEKEPMLSDYKESGGIEENADMATFLWWPSRILKENPETKEPWNEEDEKKVKWIIAKNRHGRIGTITLNFEAKYFKFINI